MISFSRIVKEEIVFNDFDQPCEKAILCAMIKIIGTLSLNQSGLTLTLRTENAKIASKLHKFLKDLYQPHIEFRVSRKMKLKKNNIYTLMVSKAREILEDLHLMEGIGIQSFPDDRILETDAQKRAYLAGVFLSCGSVNNPDTSNYHLEMSVNEQDYAMFIMELMNRYELNAKMIKRRNKYVVYLKSSEKIGDFLRAMGASKKDVSRVFNAETLIIGFTAGVIGIGVTLLLNIPINMMIAHLAGVENLSQLPVAGALILVLISMLLTSIAGLIPARFASKKDPVESLRSE